MKPVRWGVLGAARFAREHMAPAIHAAEGAEAGFSAADIADEHLGLWTHGIAEFGDQDW